MDREPQTYDELKARYLAVKKRLGGVTGPTGLVPPERVTLPQESKILEDTPVLQVRLYNRKFVTMLREVAAMHGIDPKFDVKYFTALKMNLTWHILKLADSWMLGTQP